MPMYAILLYPFRPLLRRVLPCQPMPVEPLPLMPDAVGKRLLVWRWMGDAPLGLIRAVHDLDWVDRQVRKCGGTLEAFHEGPNGGLAISRARAALACFVAHADWIAEMEDCDARRLEDLALSVSLHVSAYNAITLSARNT